MREEHPVLVHEGECVHGVRLVASQTVILKVSSYRGWINCIMREIKRRNNRAEAERRCDKVKGEFEPDNLIEEEIGEDEDQ